MPDNDRARVNQLDAWQSKLLGLLLEMEKQNGDKADDLESIVRIGWKEANRMSIEARQPPILPIDTAAVAEGPTRAARPATLVHGDRVRLSRAHASFRAGWTGTVEDYDQAEGEFPYRVVWDDGRGHEQCSVFELEVLPAAVTA